MVYSSTHNEDRRQYKHLADFLAEVPVAALTTPAGKWDQELACEIASLVGKTGCVTVRGSAKETSQYHEFQANVYDRIAIDADFALLLGEEASINFPHGFEKGRPTLQHATARAYLDTIPPTALATKATSWSGELAKEVATV
ncbi:hypothetical protein HDU87_008253, partial [Geranomyces variabilis]